MIWLRRVRPEDQTAANDFDLRDPAFVFVEVDGTGAFREQVLSSSPLRSFAGIQALLRMTGASDAPSWVLRGRAGTEWCGGFFGRLRGIPGMKIVSVDNDWRTSFVVCGPGAVLDRLGPFALDPWQDYAFGAAAEPLSSIQMEEAVIETDQQIWRRLECVRLRPECAPLLWEGAFRAQCLYFDGYLEPGDYSDGAATVRVFPGVAVVSEEHSMAHGSVADLFR